jgi:hypothetical protein
MNIGGRHRDSQRQAKGVDNNVALAAFDFLAAIIATFPAHLASANALAVDHDDRRVLVATSQLARLKVQLALYLFPNANCSPISKVAVDRPPGRKLVGQLPPLAAGLQQIQDAIDYAPFTCRAPPSAAFGSRNQGRNEQPLLIGQIGTVGRHEAPRSLPATRGWKKNSILWRTVMKNLALSMMLLVASGSAMAENLSRDRASSIIGSVLSDPKYNSIQNQISLSFTRSWFQFSACVSNIATNGQNDSAACSLNETRYRNKDYKQKVDEQVAVRLGQLVKMSEEELGKVIKLPAYISCAEFSNLATAQRQRPLSPSERSSLARGLCDSSPKVTETLISPSGNVVPITIFVEGYLDTYREALQAHLVKEFRWSFDPFRRGNDISIIDDNIRPFCQNYKDGDNICKLLIATRKLKAITGIIGSDALKQIEFQIEIAPTEIGQRLFNQTPQIENHVARFSLYDDGWRITNWDIY